MSLRAISKLLYSQLEPQAWRDVRMLRQTVPAMSTMDAARKKDAGAVLLCSFLRFSSPPMLSATSLMPLPTAFELQATCLSVASILQDLFFQSPMARYLHCATKKFVSFRGLHAWACMKPRRDWPHVAYVLCFLKPGWLSD